METSNIFPIAGSTRFRGHEHEGAHVCVVLSGGFLERDGRSWRDVAPGTVRVSGSARHDIDFCIDGAECLMIACDTDAFNTLPRARFFEHDTALRAIARTMQRAALATDPAKVMVTQSLIAELVAQVTRRLQSRNEPPPSWLTSVRDIIHDNAGNRLVSELARDAGVHRVHLARAFRDHYGVSVSAYAKQVRVQSAMRLLSSTTKPLAHVALDAGFADQSHLTRSMRSAVGLTPGRVRSMLHPFKT